MASLKRIGATAMGFVILMGVVSLFSDMTHEGARSVYGAYLTLMGASAATIGFVTGLGEMIGYSFRLLTGFLADRTRKYWTMAIVGYVVNMAAIPLLALIPQNGWIWACGLIVAERAGKAIRQPAKNTLVSYAGSQIGNGKAFAIQEFLDQIGAFLGPVLLFLILLGRSESLSAYAVSFAALGIPALTTIVILLVAKRKFPHPENFEPAASEEKPLQFKVPFVLYIVAICLFALGFIDFPIITMHAMRSNVIAESYLPLLYAGAMLVDAFSALLFGWLFDRMGMRALMISTALSACYAVFAFAFTSQWSLLIGVALWGIGMGAQESILKSAVGSLVPKQSRSTGFGIFETLFGVFWFLGSWLMGALYDQSLLWMVSLSVGAQLLAIPLFGAAARRIEPL